MRERNDIWSRLVAAFEDPTESVAQELRGLSKVELVDLLGMLDGLHAGGAMGSAMACEVEALAVVEAAGRFCAIDYFRGGREEGEQTNSPAGCSPSPANSDEFKKEASESVLREGGEELAPFPTNPVIAQARANAHQHGPLGEVAVEVKFVFGQEGGSIR